MSSAFTGNYFHSASIKSNRFDPSFLSTSSANFPIEAMGGQWTRLKQWKTGCFSWKQSSETICYTQNSTRIVKSTELLNWTKFLSTEIHSFDKWLQKKNISFNKKLKTGKKNYTQATLSTVLWQFIMRSWIYVKGLILFWCCLERDKKTRLQGEQCSQILRQSS